MPNEIVWLPGAVKDVARLREFIQEKNPAAAQHAASRIKEATLKLKDNPELGKPAEEVLPFRDMLVPFGNGNYVIRYHADALRIVVVRVRHSKGKGF